MYQQQDYFEFLDILPALFWLLIIAVVGFFIRNNNESKIHYKYYLWNLYSKLGFSLLFALVYILYYGGGDTTAYYDGAVVLNNIFFEDPQKYFEILFSDFDMNYYSYYYNNRVGYPPGWIFREPEGFFVVKLMSLISFFTLKSYFAMTFLMAYIASVATWKLFELILSFKLNNLKMLAFGILLMPSVNFWCSGVSKDTVAFIATIVLVKNTFQIISKSLSSGPKNYLYILITVLILLNVRGFILAAIGLPMSFALISRLVRVVGGGDMAVIMFRTIIILAGLALGARYIMVNEAEFLASNELIEEAAVIQNDFAENKTYGDKKYDIGTVEFTPLGLLRITPAAVIAGIYRPFPWEARSVTLVMNAIESLIFLYFTFLFIRKDVRLKWRKIQAHEFLIFCLIFVFIIGFITGLTSGLYGVLVRLRSPLLPFLFTMLTVEHISKNTETQNEVLTDG